MDLVVQVVVDVVGVYHKLLQQLTLAVAAVDLQEALHVARVLKAELVARV
tara:strand:+ start:763 stop:912 length:150 start_codon:yes stop_codon:yes gene_type:complete